MGIAHGAFCVGCCWSLMLVMFGVGLASLSAMLVLGGLTAIEKNLPSGRRLTPTARRAVDPGGGLRDRRVSRASYPRGGGRSGPVATGTRAPNVGTGQPRTRGRGSSRRRATACSRTATRTSRRGVSPRAPGSRSARSTTTSDPSCSSSSPCSRPRTSACSSASGRCSTAPEPLWVRWELRLRLPRRRTSPRATSGSSRR